MERLLMDIELWGDIGYENYEELRIKYYESFKNGIEKYKKDIEWNEKLLEFEKAFLKRGKELFEKIGKNEENDEVIDEYYEKFEENKIMEIKKE